MKYLLWGILALIVISIMGTMGAYNGLVTSQEQISANYGVVRVQEQRRYDLIPNLVSIVQGAAQYERGVLTEVTEARSRVGRLLELSGDDLANNPDLARQFLEAQQTMGSALSRLLVTVEAYPDLSATEGFQTLQVQLEGTENRISVARRDVQLSVQTYNRSRRMIPFGLIASLLGGFEAQTYFEATPESAEAPQIEFSSN